MILKNALVLNGDFQLKKLDVKLAKGRIVALGDDLRGEDERDLSGLTLVPGFVDIHTHGAVGADASDGDADGLRKMAAYLYSRGVLTFCPTTMTMSRANTLQALQTIYAVQQEQLAAQRQGAPLQQAKIAGVHLEGPFINVAKKGAQLGEYVVKPDWDTFVKYNEACGNGIKIVSVAPECDDGEFVQKAAGVCTVSIAHTCADYDQARQAFAHGVTHATHLFNAMSGLHHRNPGVVGAVFDTPGICGELICDGMHIHPAVLRLAFTALRGRVAVVSDSIRAAGLHDGEYSLGGQQVYVKDGKATLADGTIAGSSTNLLSELQNLVAFGIPFADAVRAMTLTPAKEIGLASQIGSIEVGKQADLLALDAKLEIAHRFCSI